MNSFGKHPAAPAHPGDHRRAAHHTFPDPTPECLSEALHPGEVRPHLEELSPHPEKLSAHLGEVSPHLGKLRAYLAEMRPHLGKLPAHLDEVQPHLGKLRAQLREVRAHFDELFAPLVGLVTENESLHSTLLAPRRLATAPQSESASLRTRCCVLLNCFFHPSRPRKEVALIS